MNQTHGLLTETEDNFHQTELSLSKSPTVFRLDAWKEIRLRALVHIFKDGHISLDAIIQLLEFTISQLLEVLLQKNIPLACALFDWMVITMRRAPIGSAGETVDCWLARKGGWMKVVKFSVDKRSESSSARYIPPGTILQSKSQQLNEINCKNCGGSVLKTFGVIRQQCVCGKFICLIAGCGQVFHKDIYLHQHFVNQHAKNAKLDDCLHCGYSKNRTLSICPSCDALWCTYGECCFETRNHRSIRSHQLVCKESAKQSGAAQTVPQSYNMSDTPADSQQAPSQPFTIPPPRTIQCKNCLRQFLTPFGSIEEMCPCGTWYCDIRGCTFFSERWVLLRQHFRRLHVKFAKLTECLHCGNFKNRNLTECPICVAKWCVIGDCCFETKSQVGMEVHKRACRRSKNQKQAGDQVTKACDDILEEEKMS